MGRIDLSTLLAIIASIFLIYAVIAFEGDVDAFVNPIALFFVLGGVVCIIIASNSLGAFLSSLLQVIKFIVYRPIPSHDVALASLKVAEFCYQKGTLQIEDSKSLKQKAPLFYKWVHYVIDGQTVEKIRFSVDQEIRTLADLNNITIALLQKASSVAPIVGVVGSLIGFVQLFINLSHISSIGPVIAAALLPIFYGVIFSYFILLPLSSKLEKIADQDLVNLQLYKSTALSIAEGENPRALEQTINAMLPPNHQVHYYTA